jgi:hypothetical protein
MLTVFWSVDDFHVIEFLPTDTKFNTAYFVEHIIPLLATRLEMGASKRRRILYYLHCDNAGPHNSSRSRALTNDHVFQRIPRSRTERLLPIRYPEETAGNKEFVAPEDLLRTIVHILGRIHRKN